ncbi:MAG: glycosyltransferase family 2 protein [Patescibacteria group bacterium]
MDYAKSPYFHVGQAGELTGRDRTLYRALEMLPGVLSWGTILLTIFLSAFFPIAATFFIIIFDLYWFLKTVYLSIHLRENWKRMKYNMAFNWNERLKHLKYGHVMHLVILPFYNESYEVVEKSVASLLSANFDRKKISVVLAAEKRGGKEAEDIARRIMEKYAKGFAHFLVTKHPTDVSGEMAGKGSNISYAAEEARKKILNANNISYENVIVSAFDIDTVVYPEYFSCLTWNFLTTENPYKASYQPVPVYNNNIWFAPALSRVVASSGTFWQMIQQERPERLATFSSHSVPFKPLYEGGYWQKNMVSEDSRIFWNLYMANNGNYRVVPISYPLSMDANLAPTFLQTAKNIYKQQRRWTWGVENVPYILFSFLKNKEIPIRKKINMAFMQVEGFWSLATNPIFIFLLGWLPLVLGGREFNATILSYNLPIMTRDLMILAMAGLFFSAYLSMKFLPEMPKEFKNRKRKRIYMIIQWLLIPVTITIFGAIPGLEAQTRMMLGGKFRLGFWVTPKYRKSIL